ncbi:MAG: pilus assembly protein PilP [Desulfobacteraceae bacterium]|nr:pilus assembly protein PilP [Desulfobacteraceae bacterium]
MTKRTLFIVLILFFLLPLCMGLGKAPEEQQEDIHVSQEVKIDRVQEPDEQQGGQKDEKKAEAEQKTAVQETAPKARTDQEPEKAKKPEKQDQALAGPDEQKEDSPEGKELDEMMLTEQEALFGDEQKYYTRRGRVDPFEPFLRRQTPESGEEEGEELEVRKPQTPLERIALSQLKLTAILRVPGENRAVAMVEDKDGKGYVVRKGTYIGERGGQVVDILRDRIIIKEKYKDVFGKIAEREIEKKLEN